jgi:hypothetical protein
MTVAKEIFNDPKIIEAKKLIRSVFEAKQNEFKSLKPASSKEAKTQYDELVKKLSENRGGKLFYDYIGSGFGSGHLLSLLMGVQSTILSQGLEFIILGILTLALLTLLLMERFPIQLCRETFSKILIVKS